MRSPTVRSPTGFLFSFSSLWRGSSWRQTTAQTNKWLVVVTCCGKCCNPYLQEIERQPIQRHTAPAKNSLSASNSFHQVTSFRDQKGWHVLFRTPGSCHGETPTPLLKQLRFSSGLLAGTVSVCEAFQIYGPE